MLAKILPALKNIYTQNEQLKHENELLKRKLEEKQLHINKTNQFWKRKMHQLQS